MSRATDATLSRAIRAVAADMESHLRALGRDHIDRGESVPDAVLDDMHAALLLQGELDLPSLSDASMNQGECEAAA